IFEEFIKSKKWKEILDFRSLETIVSIIVAIIISLIGLYLYNNANINDINILIRDLTKDILVTLIGLLGFTISGLAILMSGISSKVMNLISERKQSDSINNIFLSFYFQGILIGILIIILAICHITSYLDKPLYACVFIIITFILTYLIIFVVFYSIGLTGNCISVFRIVNNYSFEVDESNESNIIKNDMELLNKLKSIAMDQLLSMEKNEIDIKTNKAIYLKLIEEYISMFSEDESQERRLINYLNKRYKEEL
ncbi:hypothetical protein K1514_16625, partial [Paraclostridium bifermentans]|uniref:hypothetical protein n=2 Tax=Paraclostridium TaxID=1849822 RepID=UPI001CC59516